MATVSGVDGVLHVDDPNLVAGAVGIGVAVGNGTGAVLATGATTGHAYIPVMAGAPTGAPTAATGFAPLVLDSTNNKLWAYLNGAWKGVVLA